MNNSEATKTQSSPNQERLQRSKEDALFEERRQRLEYGGKQTMKYGGHFVSSDVSLIPLNH